MSVLRRDLWRCAVWGCGEFASDVDYVLAPREGEAIDTMDRLRAVCPRHYADREGMEQPHRPPPR